MVFLGKTTLHYSVFVFINPSLYIIRNTNIQNIIGYISDDINTIDLLHVV